MPLSMGGFGREVREAMTARAEHLADEGFARRQGQRIVFQRDLLDTLRRRELDAVGARLSAETGLPYLQPAAGEHVAGTYRQSLTLTSGRFAMIDNGLGFQLVPWSPPLEKQLGRHVVRRDEGRRRDRMGVRAQARPWLIADARRPNGGRRSYCRRPHCRRRNRSRWHPNRVIGLLGVAKSAPLFWRQTSDPGRHKCVQPIMPAARHRCLQLRFESLRFPSRASRDRKELISISLFRRLVLARGKQSADNGERIHLDDLGAGARPSAMRKV